MGRHSWRGVPQLRGLMWVMPCIVAWSLIPTLASHPGNLDALGYLFWSSVVSASFLLLCTRLTGHWPTLRAYSTTDLRRLAALAALGAFAYYALLYSTYAPCGGCPETSAVVVVAPYIWPAFAVLWSAVLLREALTCRTLVSLLVGIVAVIIGVSGGAHERDALSKLPAVVLAAAIFGLYSTLLKRTAYEPYSSMAVGFTVATFLSLLAVVQFPTNLLIPDGPAARSVLINGVFVNGLSSVFWYRALQAARISLVAPWVALTPLLAAVFAGKSIRFDTAHIVGIGVVLVSALLATITSNNSASEPLPGSIRRYQLAEESS